jgi:DNA-binding HxlR family transcriptional regulator
MASQEEKEALFATLDEMQADGLITWERFGSCMSISLTPKGTSYAAILETLYTIALGPSVEVSTS